MPWRPLVETPHYSIILDSLRYARVVIDGREYSLRVTELLAWIQDTLSALEYLAAREHLTGNGDGEKLEELRRALRGALEQLTLAINTLEELQRQSDEPEDWEEDGEETL